MILSAQQSSLLDQVFRRFCGIRRRRPALLLAAYRSTEAFGSSAALCRRRRALLLFAIGSGALVLYGLSGCSGAGGRPHLGLAIEDEEIFNR